MSKLTKDFGLCGADVDAIANSVIKSPSPSLNWSVGNGGFPEGKAILFYGPESGGKSLLAQLIEIAIQQKYSDGICVLIDTEFSFVKEWFIKLGGDPSRLYLRQTNDPIQIFDWIEKELQPMIKEGCPVRSIRIDSIKMIRFPKDIREESTKLIMGGSGAAYLGSALKGILPVIRNNKITTLFVQQVYEEMDQYKKMRNPYLIPDGRALKHFCDLMIQVERLETKDGSIELGKTIAGGAQQIGHIVRTKTRKNRCGAPYRVAEFALDYTKGIVNVGEEIFNLGKCLDVITHPAGSSNQMWVFGNHEPIRGEENIKQWVINNPKIQEEIVAACSNVSEEVINKMNNTVKTTDMAIEGEENA